MDCIKSITLSAILLLLMDPMQAKTTKDSSSMVTVNPEEYTRALRNPLKGFTNRGAYENNEWATLMHSYIKWNEIERDSLDDIPEIKQWCETNWAGVEDKKHQSDPARLSALGRRPDLLARRYGNVRLYQSPIHPASSEYDLETRSMLGH
jgi:hypothetical protein